MKRIMKELRPFKVPLIMVLIFGVLYIIINFVLPGFVNFQANKTPIVSITADNEYVYKQGDKIKESDFKVRAEHESGKTSVLENDAYEITPKVPDQYGPYTRVTISLKENPDIKTILRVKNDRTAIASFECGKPEKKSVKAVVYSNGELAFEGSGDVLEYNEDEFPWKESDYEIKSVTFDKEITPISMDYWFSDISTLEFIGELPVSVESAIGMCENCSSLKKAPTWIRCKNLLDVTDMYKNCSALTEIPALTKTVRTATGMCENCISLQDAPDLSNAMNLQKADRMYKGCKALTTATTMPPSVKIIDEMYSDCINLKSMPDLPNSVESLEDCFLNNKSLQEVKNIPANAKNVSSCFAGCSKIKGQLQIDATPENYSAFLQGACNATTLNLTGNSSILNELALTNETGNITVNGYAPVVTE